MELEQAARKLCHIRGLDPDKDVQYVNECDSISIAPQWTQLVDEIKRHIEIKEAIKKNPST